jgi:hypothetical protein
MLTCLCSPTHYLACQVKLLKSTSSAVAVSALLLVGACSSDNEPPAAPQTPAYTAVAGPTAAPDIPEPAVGQSYTTASGLHYEVLRAGTGRRPASKYDSVRVHYHGTLLDGTVFDSSVDRGEPIVFSLNQVISGWTEGVQLMREGSKYRFRVPHYLAYGIAGKPPTIGPKKTLMFDIELIEVVP